MKFLKDFDFTAKNIFKILGGVLLAVIIIFIVIRILSVAVTPVFRSAPSMVYNESAYDMGYAGANYYEKGVVSDMDLSMRNIGIPSPTTPTTGDDAEDFEVTNYNISFQTNSKEKICGQIVSLKSFDYVIFENSNEHERGCDYTFKVKKDNKDQVLGMIQDLKPRDFSENTYTIKNQVDDYTSESEILKNKLKSIDETLSNAVKAYDNVTALATRTSDVESLAKIIDSRLNLIERLTQERIDISSSLERIERQKSEQLDRLEYDYFNVSVYENKYFDWQYIKDSWKDEFKSFVNDMNRVLQDITINLLSFMFILAQYIIYLLVLVLVGKYLWIGAKYLWNK